MLKILKAINEFKTLIFSAMVIVITLLNLYLGSKLGPFAQDIAIIERSVSAQQKSLDNHVQRSQNLFDNINQSLGEISSDVSFIRGQLE